MAMSTHLYDLFRFLAGDVSWVSGQVLAHVAPQKSGDRFAAFLAQIAQTWPEDHLVLVMDNVSYHRSQAMRDWWAAQDGGVTPFWLPAYTPTLNLVERVWRYLKQKLACHRFWNDVAGLEAAATRLLNQMEAHFHAAEGPSIFLRQDFCQSA
jgi:transposase